MSRGKPFKIFGIAIFILGLILILNNVSKDISYKTVEAEVTGIESHLKTISRSGTAHVTYNYIRYTVGGKEYTACIHGDYGAEVGSTISVRYKPSKPTALLPKNYKVADEMNMIVFLLAVMVFGTGEILDKQERPAGTGLFGIG